MKMRGRRSARPGISGSALLIGSLLGGVLIGDSGFAQERAGVSRSASGETETQVRARELRANQLILEVFERRRLALDAKPDSTARQNMIAFLDSRIKLFRISYEKDIEFFRRSS